MADHTAESWDRYWNKERSIYAALYDRVARFYRTVIIDQAVARVGRQYFAQGSLVLHAGCGSGATDIPLQREVRIVALDLSGEALALYRRLHLGHDRQIQGDISAMPIRQDGVDGLLSIGVVEHFESGNLPSVLAEHARVVRPGGFIVVLWPPIWGLSVRVLAAAERIVGTVLRRSIRLHPPEPTLYRSRDQIRALIRGTGLELVRSTFGWRDAFTHQFVILRRVGA